MSFDDHYSGLFAAFGDVNTDSYARFEYALEMILNPKESRYNDLTIDMRVNESFIFINEAIATLEVTLIIERLNQFFDIVNFGMSRHDLVRYMFAHGYTQYLRRYYAEVNVSFGDSNELYFKSTLLKLFDLYYQQSAVFHDSINYEFLRAYRYGHEVDIINHIVGDQYLEIFYENVRQVVPDRVHAPSPVDEGDDDDDDDESVDYNAGAVDRYVKSFRVLMNWLLFLKLIDVYAIHQYRSMSLYVDRDRPSSAALPCIRMICGNYLQRKFFAVDLLSYMLGLLPAFNDQREYFIDPTTGLSKLNIPDNPYNTNDLTLDNLKRFTWICYYFTSAILPSMIRDFYRKGHLTKPQTMKINLVARLSSSYIKSREIEIFSKWISQADLMNGFKVEGLNNVGVDRISFLDESSSIRIDIELSERYPLSLSGISRSNVTSTGRSSDVDTIRRVLSLLFLTDGNLFDYFMQWQWLMTDNKYLFYAAYEDTSHDQQLNCSICHGSVETSTILPVVQCRQCYRGDHMECVLKNLAQRNECACCRQKLIHGIHDES